jgi:transposase
MARKPHPFEATEPVHAELLTRARAHKLESRHVQRAKVILLSLEGKTLDEVVRLSGLSRKAANQWRNRFRELGLDGLKDLPRCGKKPTITPEQRASVVQLACEKPSGGYTNWSQRRIAEAVGISKSRVNVILAEADVKPHRTEYWCGKSPDPEFESKMTDIIGLYMSPPNNAIVICVDEKTGIQALDRTQPVLPLRPGNPKRLTATYKRNGTVSLIAALSVHSGEVRARTMESNNAENFLSFLKVLDRAHPRKHLHIIADNLSVHKSEVVKNWLARKRKITIHYTPTYSSWLNQVEIWFNILTKDVVKGGVWTSRKQLVDQLLEYVVTYNTTRAAPFKWTYTGKPLAI